VARELDSLVALYGRPKTIVSDSVIELISRAMLGHERKAARRSQRGEPE